LDLKALLHYFPVGKIAEKALCRSVFSHNMALYFECRTELTKTHSFRLLFLATGLSEASYMVFFR